LIESSSANTKRPATNGLGIARRQLHRGHEGVVAPLRDAHPEQRLDGAQQIRGARDGDRHQDRLECKHKPTKALLAMVGEWKKKLEITCQVA